MFDWNDFMTLAEDLIKNPSEAAQRSAVSRAYYAAFCVARNWLKVERSEYISDSAAAHKEVALRFEDESDKQLRGIGQNLRRLRYERNDADYKPSLRNISTNAPKSLAIAKSVTSTISRHSSPKSH